MSDYTRIAEQHLGYMQGAAGEPARQVSSFTNSQEVYTALYYDLRDIKHALVELSISMININRAIEGLERRR